LINISRSHEHAIISLTNEKIVRQHLLCASKELALDPVIDKEFFGDDIQNHIQYLENQNLISESDTGWLYTGNVEFIQGTVSLNSISNNSYKMMFNGREFQILDERRAYAEGHEGAVYLHLGETFIIDNFDENRGIIEITRQNVDYYTESVMDTDIEIIKAIFSKKFGKLTIFYGDVNVTENYSGYKIIKFEQKPEFIPFDPVSLSFITKGLWFTVADEMEDEIEHQHLELIGGLHGIEHAMIGVLPYHVMCDRRDLGGLSTNYHPLTKKGTIFIYDGAEGGVGLTEMAVSLFDKIASLTYELIRDCKCTSGCPACIQSPKCGNKNQSLDKQAALYILSDLIKKISTNKITKSKTVSKN
jgi:DEAD/DEAH box helicase domain-containing protein